MSISAIDPLKEHVNQYIFTKAGLGYIASYKYKSTHPHIAKPSFADVNIYAGYLPQASTLILITHRERIKGNASKQNSWFIKTLPANGYADMDDEQREGYVKVKAVSMMGAKTSLLDKHKINPADLEKRIISILEQSKASP
jgi:hypothetical protein